MATRSTKPSKIDGSAPQVGIPVGTVVALIATTLQPGLLRDVLTVIAPLLAGAITAFLNSSKAFIRKKYLEHESKKSIRNIESEGTKILNDENVSDDYKAITKDIVNSARLKVLIAERNRLDNYTSELQNNDRQPKPQKAKPEQDI